MWQLRHEIGILVAWGDVLSSSWTRITGGKIHLQENAAVCSNLDIFITKVPLNKMTKYEILSRFRLIDTIYPTNCT